MYLPAAFRSTDRGLLLSLMRRHPFATAIGVEGGAPEIAHLPVLVADEREMAELMEQLGPPRG